MSTPDDPHGIDARNEMGRQMTTGMLAGHHPRCQTRFSIFLGQPPNKCNCAWLEANPPGVVTAEIHASDCAPCTCGAGRAERLTDDQIADLIAAGIIDYLTCRDEQGMTHEEALEQVKSETAESVACARGECNH